MIITVSSYVSVFDGTKIFVLTVVVLTVMVLSVAGIKSRRNQMSRYYVSGINLRGMKCRGTKSLDTVADSGFWIRGVKFKKFRPKPPILSNVTVGLYYTLHENND